MDESTQTRTKTSVDRKLILLLRVRGTSTWTCLSPTLSRGECRASSSTHQAALQSQSLHKPWCRPSTTSPSRSLTAYRQFTCFGNRQCEAMRLPLPITHSLHPVPAPAPAPTILVRISILFLILVIPVIDSFFPRSAFLISTSRLARHLSGVDKSLSTSQRLGNPKP